MATMFERLRPLPNYSLISIKDIIRFWSKICVKNNNDCWNWQYAIIDGYGIFYLLGNIYLSNRLTYYFENKIDPFQKLVLHKCNNRKCCNPLHLYLGDSFDNMQQRSLENRNNQDGELNPNAKLNKTNILAIIQESKNITRRSLAIKYGINKSTIDKILSKKIWKHLWDQNV